MQILGIPEMFLTNPIKLTDVPVSNWVGVPFTLVTVAALAFIQKRPAAWEALALKRRTWLLLIVVAWLGGAALRIALLCVINP